MDVSELNKQIEWMDVALGKTKKKMFDVVSRTAVVLDGTKYFCSNDWSPINVSMCYHMTQDDQYHTRQKLTILIHHLVPSARLLLLWNYSDDTT